MASENPSASTNEGKNGVQLKHPKGAEGENAFETPAKRQKKSNKYQAFDSEEKQQLKKYEALESQARKILNRTYDKLFEDLSRDDTQKEMDYFRRRLTALKKKTSLDPICIGFFGQTGAGKTSLLNAILGKKLFLPVSGSSVCTSCVVQVNTSRADQYEATIHLLTDDEWKEELKNLVEILSKNGCDEDDDDDDCNDCVKDAREKLHAVYGEGARGKGYEALLQTNLPVTVPTKRIIVIKEQEAQELSRKLGPYIRVRDKRINKLWPLIKYVEVTIPGSEILPEGIMFLDIPGTGDFNRRRDEMWKQSINKCSVIWIISDTERVEGEKIQPELLEEGIKAFLGGVCTDIALVVTKSDKMDLEEYESERTNDDCPLESAHNAILERNQDVKNSKERIIKKKLQRRLPSYSEVLQKPKLVYTVSAREFWDPKHLSKEETEIPELREYLRKIYLKEKEKLVKDYVTEVWGIHWLAKNFGSRPQPEDLVFQESGVKELMLKEINFLGNNLEKCFDEIKKPLFESVEHARKKYKNTVTKLLTRHDGYRGYHKTLKAVCLKDGIYASRRFARIDFNESLAKPIYDKIDGIFGSIFRTQNATRLSLWSHLEMFKNEVQRKIRQTGEDNHLPNNGDKIEIFIQEVNAILKELEKQILQSKISIYQSLCESIQSDLKPHYKAASKVKGHGTYEQMKKILMEGIEHEVKNQMFEKAKSMMESQFHKLQSEILEKLEVNILIVFNLVFLQQERATVHLAAHWDSRLQPAETHAWKSDTEDSQESSSTFKTNKFRWSISFREPRFSKAYAPTKFVSLKDATGLLAILQQQTNTATSLDLYTEELQ